MKSKHAAILAVVLFLLGALSGGLLQRSWDLRSIAQTDTATVWQPAVLDTTTMAATTTEAPPSIPPVVVPADRIEQSEGSTAIRIRSELTTVTGTLSGGLTYQAQLTGIQPQLHSLQVNYPETTITRHIQEPYKGWLVSATSNIYAYAAQPFQAFGLIALETSYNTGRFHIGFQGGVADTWSPATGHQVSPYIGARVTIDIFRMR